MNEKMESTTHSIIKRGPRAAIMGSPAAVDEVYTLSRRGTMETLCDLHDTVVTVRNLKAQLDRLREVEVIFATWGMPVLEPEDLDRMPELRAVFYAAGTVQRIAPPLLERGILVVSGWMANAVPVAEFTLAQITLANKGYFHNVMACSDPITRPDAYRGLGNFDVSVALLGCGAIARLVIEKLRPMAIDVLVNDPFVSDEEADRLGVTLVGLDEAFDKAQVVSNHLPNKPELQRVIGRSQLARLRPHAVFINTGRGAQVNEDELAAVMHDRPDLVALLDVTAPEPPAVDSPLYALPNVHITSHIAGAQHHEKRRLADFAIGAFQTWWNGQTPPGRISIEMLDLLA